MSLNVPLLEQSFALAAPIEEAKQALAEECYATLLRLHPDVEPLFAQTNREVQARKLMATLSLVLHVLKEPDVLTTTLQRLGRTPSGDGSTGRALSDGSRGASGYICFSPEGSVDSGDTGRLD